ncbi:caspase family protein [Microbacteriaceae bacterium VKM Ac-2855]|nr:caspase family protein [Microbacteriaceae bacterium VKM Ac-2855]
MTTEDARGRRYSTEEIATLKKHVIAMKNGRLIDPRDGDALLITTSADLDALVNTHLAGFVEKQRAAKPQAAVPIMLHAHGGLVPPASALDYALHTIDWWLGMGVYPLYFVWDSNIWDALGDAMTDAMKGWWTEGRGDFIDGQIELLLRNVLGPRVWGAMKDDARASSDARVGGAYRLATELGAYLAGHADEVSVNAVGHSAGSIFHAHFLPVLLQSGAKEIRTLSLLAPAVRVDTFQALVAPLLRNGGLGEVAVFTMDDATEQNDNCFTAYQKSLLYLVRGAFEAEYEAPLLGLQIAIDADADLRRLFGRDGTSPARADLVFSPGSAGPRSESGSTSHGRFDTDPATMQSVARRIVGRAKVPDFPPTGESGRGDGRVDGYMPYEVPPIRLESTVQPHRTRRAVCIGIDRYAERPLHGCVADALAWQAALEQLGFDVLALHDEAATKSRILREITLLVANSRPGDSIVVQYAGHGTEVPDLDGDEAVRRGPDAKKDQALVPYGSGLGTTSGEYVIDDDLGRIWDTVPEGVHLTVFFDSCRSGDAVRGPELVASGTAEAAIAAAASVDGLEARVMVLDTVQEEAYRAARGTPTTVTSVTTDAAVSFSACSPVQVAYENNRRGVFSVAAVPLLASSVGLLTNAQFIDKVVAALGTNPQQNPGYYGPDAFRSRPLLGVPFTDAPPESESPLPVLRSATRSGADPAKLAAFLRATADLLEG